MAFAYPVITLVIAWWFGVDALIGDAALLEPPEAVVWWQRALFVTPFLAAAVALTGLVAFGGPFGLGRILTRTFVGSVILAVVVAAALAAAGSLAAAVALAGSLALVFSWSLTVAGLLPLAAASFLWLAGVPFNDVKTTAIALLWFILPWLNASFDWVSWQVSRRLGYHLLHHLDDDDRSSLRQIWDNPVTHVMADVAAACLLLVGLAWALPAVIRLYNRLIESLGSSAPLVLDDYLCTTAQDPFGAGIWATVMLISTLVPTLVHLGFVFASPFIRMFQPHHVWDARAAHLEGRGPPPAVDLRGMPPVQRSSYDPTSHQAGLAENGTPWLLPLHPEVTKKVAWELKVAQPLLQFMMVFAAALLLLDLVLAWDLIWNPGSRVAALGGAWLRRSAGASLPRCLALTSRGPGSKASQDSIDGRPHDDHPKH